MEDVHNGGGFACVELGGDIWKIVVPSSQLCCEPKIALKKEVFKLRKNSAWRHWGGYKIVMSYDSRSGRKEAQLLIISFPEIRLR